MPDDLSPTDKLKSHKLIKKEENSVEEVFDKTKADLVYTATKAGLSTIPYVGGVLSEIFASKVDSPFHNRLKNYLTPLEARVKKLENEERLNTEELIKNEEFIDVISKSAQIAVVSSKTEKLDALRNIVMNSAIGIDIDHDKKMMCLNVIDRITPTHLKVLSVLANPESVITTILENDQNLKNFSIPDDFNKFHLKIDVPTFNVVLNDLKNMGLVVNRGTHTMGLEKSSTSSPSSGLTPSYYCTPEGTARENVVGGTGASNSDEHTHSLDSNHSIDGTPARVSTPISHAIAEVVTESRDFITPFGWQFLDMINLPKLEIKDS